MIAKTTNPILYKDMLLSMNSTIGQFGLFFFVLVYMIISLLVLISYKEDMYYSQVGLDVFRFVGTLQLFVLSIICMLKGLLSLAPEIENKTMQFILISPLRFALIIWGKFLSIFLYAVILLLLSLPFLSIALFLGGVDISALFEYGLYSLTYASIAIFFGMALSVIAKKASQAILYGLGMLVFLLARAIFFGANMFFFDLGDPVYGEVFLSTFLPIRVFSDIFFTPDQYIKVFGIPIHYLLHHLAVFCTVSYALFRFTSRQLGRAVEDVSISFDIGVAVSFLFFFLLRGYLIPNADFLWVWYWLIFVIANFLYSLPSYSPSVRKSLYIYISWVLGISVVFFAYMQYNRSWGFLAMTLVVVSLFVGLHAFLSRWSHGQPLIVGILHLFIILCIFYIIPHISTYLFGYDMANISEILKSIIINTQMLEYHSCYDMSTLCKERTIVYYPYLIGYGLIGLVTLGLGLYHNKK